MQVDAGNRARQLAHIARRRADQAAKLAERPAGGRDRTAFARDQQGETFRIVHVGLDPDRLAFNDPRASGLGAGAHARLEVVEREEALVGRSAEPFGRNAAIMTAAADIDLVARRLGRLDHAMHVHGDSPDGGCGRAPCPSPAAPLPHSLPSHFGVDRRSSQNRLSWRGCVRSGPCAAVGMDGVGAGGTAMGTGIMAGS